jgi:hypothetical protein
MAIKEFAKFLITNGCSLISWKFPFYFQFWIVGGSVFENDSSPLSEKNKKIEAGLPDGHFPIFISGNPE